MEKDQQQRLRVRMPTHTEIQNLKMHVKAFFPRVLEIIKTSAFTTLLLFIFVYFLVYQYCKLSFYRDPGSRFYDEDRAFVRWYSEYRERQARSHIAAANTSDILNFYKAGENPSVCAAMITSKRENLNFVEASVGSILEGLTPEERSDLYLSVHFANTNPSIHPSWDQPWLNRLVDKAYTYETSDVIYQYMSDMEHNRKSAEKNIIDYTYALQSCYNTGANWIVVFDDDIIVADGWFSRTLIALYEVEVNTLKTSREWLYMRLFNEERMLGWGSKDIGSHSEPWISLGVVCFILGVVQAARPRSRLVRKYMDTGRLVVICVIAVPAFVILFFQAGKASTLPPSPGVREENFGSVSKGLVFPSRQVPSLIDTLRHRRKGDIARFIDDLSIEAGMARLSLYPVQIQHIGLETSESDVDKAWSMAFEVSNPKKLRKQHKEMVSMLYAENLSSQR